MEDEDEDDDSSSLVLQASGYYAQQEARAVSGKSPMVYQRITDREAARIADEDFGSESSSEVEVVLPDLGGYFDEFGTDPRERISMCRKYASYLASLLPKKKRKTK